MKLSVLLGILLLLGQPLSAGALTRGDFAYGFELQMQEQGAIFQLPLPEKIYTTVVQPDLADIRVFNGAGSSVPHLLKLEQEEPSQVVREEDLPFSPLYDFVPTGTVRSVETHIAKGVEGVGKGAGSIDVNRTIRQHKEEVRQLTGYLVDTSGVDSIPFRLHYTIGGENDFMTTVTLEGSDDLTNWSFISRETLARLHYHGHLIEKNGNSPIQGKKKYIRVSWPVDGKTMVLEKIRAISNSSTLPPVRNWTTLTPTLPEKQPADNTIVLEFDSKGRLPVDTIRVGFSGGNHLFQGVLKSRPDRKEEWRFRGQGIFYRLQEHDALLQNDTISLSATTDRYWQLEIVTEGGTPSRDGLPRLELGWRPHTLYFLNQGGGPYTLSFGSGRLQSAVRNSENGLADLLQQVAKQQRTIQAAHLGREIELGGPDMLIPLPPPPPWKKWLLWGMLIGGVMLIGVMAYSLHRQIKSTGASAK